MKLLPALGLLLAALSGQAYAQLPLPFGPPEPSTVPQCTKGYVKSLASEIAAMGTLRANGPAFVGQICTLIEAGSALVGGELSQSTRQQIKDLLGVDVDLRFIRTQCRVSQGNLDREVMSHIGYLKSELLRCDGTI